MGEKSETTQLQKLQESNLKNNTTTRPEDTENSVAVSPAKEIGGRTQGLEPTRYGDWEFKGRCIDF